MDNILHSFNLSDEDAKIIKWQFDAYFIKNTEVRYLNKLKSTVGAIKKFTFRLKVTVVK